MSSEPKVKSVVPDICYKDDKAAVQWLQDAFGFEIGILLTDSDGNIAHCEMRAGAFGIGVMGEWSKFKSPKSLGDVATHQIALSLESGIDDHCERARKAGATILREPADQFYGDRNYSCADPEGNVWSFGQHVRDVSKEEMEKATGLTVDKLS